MLLGHYKVANEKVMKTIMKIIKEILETTLKKENKWRLHSSNKKS